MNLFDGYGRSLLDGLIRTLLSAVSACLLASLIGILGAWIKIRYVKLGSKFVGIYVRLFRGIPELAWIFLFYFGGEFAFNSLLSYYSKNLYIPFNGAVIGTMCIGCIYGAYNIENFYGGFSALPVRQLEAARTCGLAPHSCFTSIIFPQVFVTVLPGFMSTWLNLLKATSILSLISVDDIVKVANNAGNSTKQPFKFWVVVSLFFLVITFFSKLVAELMIRKLDPRRVR